MNRLFSGPVQAIIKGEHHKNSTFLNGGHPLPVFVMVQVLLQSVSISIS